MQKADVLLIVLKIFVNQVASIQTPWFVGQLAPTVRYRSDKSSGPTAGTGMSFEYRPLNTPPYGGCGRFALDTLPYLRLALAAPGPRGPGALKGGLGRCAVRLRKTLGDWAVETASLSDSKGWADRPSPLNRMGFKGSRVVTPPLGR